MVVCVVEFMCHAKQSATAHCSVVTTALTHASRTARHARNTVATTASIASVERSVVNHVIPVTRHACGNANITDARNCVGSCAIAQDATCHVQSYFRAGIPVLACAGNDAQRCAASVIRTPTSLLFSERKTVQVRDSWSWQTVVTCLKLK